MIFKMLCLKIMCFCFLIVCEAAFEGDLCTKDGLTGTCTRIETCRAAMEDIRNRRNPQICGFVGSIPVVCCLDKPVATVPPFTTTSTTTRTSTGTLIDKRGGCDPIPAELTTTKTGQKAFDKCLDYQEQCVYPCERSVAFTGELIRGFHCHHNVDDLIIGGTDAQEDEFPHMVMLGYGDNIQSLKWMCGGTIISERFVLTAGHCISSREEGGVSHVLVGAHTRSDSRQTSNIYKIRNTIKHPEYKPPSKYNDIALLEMEKTIKLSQFIVPACLPVGEVNDERVLATGWGLTSYRGNASEILQKVILEKFPSNECLEKYPVHRLMRIGFDAQTQTCYGDRTKSKDTCQGDSGGPIQIKSKKIKCMYTVVGVTSFGKACGFAGEPAIYTRVANYVPWIESIVWP